MSADHACTPSRGSADDPQRCRRLTARVRRLAASSVALQATFVALIWSLPAASSGAFVVVGLTVIWLVALWLFQQNYLLIRTGPQAIRHALAPSLLNRPDAHVRLLFHLITNWSVIATTLTAAWLVQSSGIASIIVGVAVVATVFVWVAFNVMHRRMNRFKNLALSTTLAVACLITAFRLSA